MLTPARIAGHPIHPMLVPIPIGLWLFSFACDLARLGGGTSPNWEIAAYYTMIGGVVGAVVAALPGTVDMLSLPGGLRRIALIHMALNVGVGALYAVNAWQRSRGALEIGTWLSVVGVAALGISGWLGGKMVYEHGVGVNTGPEAEPEDTEALPRRRADVPRARAQRG
jgi:uncharacterized membrane protein